MVRSDQQRGRGRGLARVFLVAGLVGLGLLGCEYVSETRTPEPSAPNSVHVPPPPSADHPVITLAAANFEKKVLQEKQLVLVDFTATWCGPCQVLKPTLHALAKDYVGKIVFGELDADENEDLVKNYNVEFFPTLILFRNGQEVERLIGVLPREELQRKFDKHLNNS